MINNRVEFLQKFLGAVIFETNEGSRNPDLIGVGIMSDDLLRDVREIRIEKEKKRLTKFKVWYLIILIIVVALIGGGLWIYITGQDMSWLSTKVSEVSDNTKTTQDEEDTAVLWKTYTDTDLGYAFKYPAIWDIDVSVTSATGDYDRISLVRVDLDVISDQEGEDPPEVEFWVTVYNKKYQTYNKARKTDKGFTDQKSEDATLASQDGKKYTFISSEFGKRKQNDLIFALDNNQTPQSSTDQTIVLSYLSGSEEIKNLTNILKSFRFQQVKQLSC